MDIIAFTGAGISRSSGIKTFQEQEGIRDYLHRSYAQKHPEKYREIMREFCEAIDKAKPNDAHFALADYKIPIITMNVDGLHQKAGSKDVLEIHGSLPTKEELPICDTLYNKPVLYEDAAPMYRVAHKKLSMMHPGDLLLTIGVSGYTQIASDLQNAAQFSGMHCITINRDAVTLVRKVLKALDKSVSFTEQLPTILELVDEGIELNF